MGNELQRAAKYADSVETFFKAVRCGDVEKVKTLLDENPTLINEKNRVGETCLMVASECNQAEIVTLLLGRDGAGLNKSELVNFCKVSITS